MDPEEKKSESFLNWLAWSMTGYSRLSRNYQDLRSILNIIFLEIPDGTPLRLARKITKNKAIDAVKSRCWNYSYGNKIPHVCFADPALIETQTNRREPFVEEIPEALIADSWEDNIVEDRLVGEMLQAIRDNSEEYGERDAEVLRLYFLKGINQTEIGKVFNVSRSMISKILGQVFQFLREEFTHEDIFGA